MAQNNFNKLPIDDQKIILQETSRLTGLPDFAVEKDWWVIQTLAIIFEMEIGNHLVFKGGTSLSKGWKLIDRFSEDIDLAVDRNFLGFEGDLSKRQVTELRKCASEYITEKFYPELIKRFQEKGFEGVTFELVEAESSDQDPRIIEIHYPNITNSPGYIHPKVQVEIGCRSLREPYSIRSCSSLVDEYFPDSDFSQSQIEIPVVNPERTLLEKIFLLHEEFQRPSDKIRVNRLSRHLYDINQLSKIDHLDKAINDKVLYETIVKHRHTFTRLGGVNYNLHQPQSINPIPPADLIENWKTDYKTMQQQMIYGDSPSFDQIIVELSNLTSRINAMDWTFSFQFPTPNK